MYTRRSVLIKRSRDLEMRTMTRKEYLKRVNTLSHEYYRVRPLWNEGEHREYGPQLDQISAQINYYAQYENWLINEEAKQ